MRRLGSFHSSILLFPRALLSGSIVRLLYFVTFISVIPALLLIAFLGHEKRQDLIEDFKEDTSNVAEAVSILQTRFAGSTRQMLEALAQVLSSLDPEDAQGRQRLLQKFQASNPVYRSFLIADAKGNVTSSALPLDGPLNVTDRRYWQEARRTGRFSAGEFVFGRVTRKPTFHFALPLNDGDRGFDGIVFVSVELTFPKEFLAQLSLPPDTSIALVDHQGLRMFRYPSSSAFRDGEPISPVVWEQLRNPSPDGFFQRVGADGLERLFTARPLRLEGEAAPYAYIMLSVPLRSVLAQARAELYRNLALLGLACLMALATARWIGRRTLCRQVDGLLEAARRLGEGDLTARTRLDGLGGELGELARSFDSMAAKLDLRDRQHRQDQDALRASERKFRALFENAFELVGLLTADGLVMEANVSALQVIGTELSQVVGRPLWETPWWNDDPARQERVRQAVAEAKTGRTVRFETSLRRPDGSLVHLDFSLKPVLDEDGEVILLVPEARDITERIEMEARLRHLALHDPLTGLANRTLLRDRIEQAQAWGRRHPGQGFALLFLDLNRFKAINDNLGHAVGDDLLVQAGRRLAYELREADTVARFGGDEFVVLLAGVGLPREAVKVASRLGKALRQPFVVGTKRIDTSASIGMVLDPSPADLPDELIRNASLAMIYAKGKGRGRPVAFTGKLYERIISGQAMEGELLQALDAPGEGQLFPVFQPIVDTAGGIRPVGFEVLSRWRHPRRGVVPPSVFIPVAEESGAIIKLGEWVIEEACATLAWWRDQGVPEVFFSVNVSPRQLSLPSFVPFVRRILERYAIPAGRLKLEFTETALMESTPLVQERLRELASLGVGLGVDDFGTGYSNMALLTRLPLSDLKIDLSIVAGAEKKPENAAIIKAILTMAGSLGLDVVAEGVETEGQRDMLEHLGCRMQQGFLFAKPMTAGQAVDFLGKCVPEASVIPF